MRGDISIDLSRVSSSESESDISTLLQNSALNSPISAVSESCFSNHINNYPYLHFVNATLCEAGELFPDSNLWVDTLTGKIISPPTPMPQNVQIIDLEGAILSPGFLDVQLNGAFGFDFSDDKFGDGSAEAFKAGLANVSRKLVKTGVTSFCPTLPSTFKHVYHKVLPLLKADRINTGAENLGVHLEGPFLSPQKPGCHPQDAIKTAPNRIGDFYEVYGEKNLKAARMITVAAEQEGVMESIRDIADLGVTVCLGHSVLKYAGGCEAVRNGATMVTHVYNAMKQPHHREMGLFGLLGASEKDLTETRSKPPTSVVHERPFFGIIVDGIHVHPSGVKIAYNSYPEGCVLVTDAMAPMGLPSGTYPWSTQTIVKQGLKLFLNGTDTIAGSAVEMDISVRNLMNWVGISLAEAVKTCTYNAAKSIGVLGTKGTLKTGADADLCVLDSNGKVKQVYKLGCKVFQATKA
ncbi:hypothetical protein TRVA0_010S02718 [Trichomonascus vanleenenianus]|uniref:N-acetylglucosamine-6-phosphate deacetylase n=1 Tax=Trichomonascus vanleenenianus TaxID=2268995 RepID=UPI003ECBAAB4